MTPEQAWHSILQQRQYPGDTIGQWRETETVAEADEARQLLQLFRPLIAPLADGEQQVLAQMGQSLDGRIATITGKSRYINGDDGLVHLHRLRAVSDAVLVGSGTASADNPRLTVRLACGPNPVRVLVDRHRLVPASHHLFNDRAAPTLHLVAGHFEPESLPAKLTAEVYEIPCLSDSDGPIIPREVLNVLRTLGLRRIFVEGGGQTVSTFLSAGLVDRLHVMVAPMIIGSGQPAFRLPEIDSLGDALRPKASMINLGSDMLFDLDFSGR